MVRKKKWIFRLIILFCILIVIYRVNGVRIHMKGDLNLDNTTKFSTEKKNKVFLYIYLRYLGEKISFDYLNGLITKEGETDSIKDIVDSIDKYSFLKIPRTIDYVKRCIDHKIPVILFANENTTNKDEKDYPLFIVGYNSISGKFILFDPERLFRDSFFISTDSKVFRIDAHTLKDHLKEAGGAVVLKKYSSFYESDFERSKVLSL